jgi:hypothetical protein
MNKALKSIDKKFVIILGLCCLLLVAVSAYGGYYLRHSGDDFSLSTLASMGPLSFFRIYFTRINGRFSYVIVSLVLYQFPRLFIRLTPIFFYCLFVGGFYTFFKRVTGSVEKLCLLALSLVLTFSLATLPVNIYQTIYWLPAFLAYGLPLGLLLLLFSYLVRVDNKVPSSFSFLVLFAGALAIGGFNELVAVLGSFLLAVVFCLIEINNRLTKGSWDNASLLKRARLFLAAIAGFIASFIVNFIVPATSYRSILSHTGSFHGSPPLSIAGRISNYDDPLTVALSKREILVQSWAFSVNTLKSTLGEPIVIFVILAALLISIVIYRGKFHQKITRQLHSVTVYLSLSAALLVPFLVLFICAFVSNYAQGSNPADRELLPFYFSLILCIALVSLIIGVLCKTLTRTSVNSTIGFLMIASLIVSAFTFYHSGRATIALNKELHAQMISQDGRDQYIRSMLSKGTENIHIQPFVTVGDTPYPKSDPKYWLNEDMASYYGAASLVAK